MGEDEYDPPIILGRPFLSTVKAIIYIGTREVHMHFPSEKVHRYFKDFSKIKFSRILASLGTDKQQLNLPISYPLTT